MLFAACCSFASNGSDIVRPITVDYGVCMLGMPEVNIRINVPVDVDLASLVYSDRIIGRFETGILAPDPDLTGVALDRWRNGELVVVRDKWGWLGIKRRLPVNDTYPNAYIRVKVDPHAPPNVTESSLMHALRSCDLKAKFSYSPAPAIGSLVPGIRD